MVANGLSGGSGSRKRNTEEASLTLKYKRYNDGDDPATTFKVNIYSVIVLLFSVQGPPFQSVPRRRDLAWNMPFTGPARCYRIGTSAD